MLEADGLNPQLGRRKAIEDVLRVVRPVVVADAGMIAADDEMGAAVVLAHQRVEHGLARTGVAHRGGKTGEQHAIARIVALEQHAVARDAHRGGDVVVLGRPEQRMQQQSVHRLERRLLDVFMRAVHRVACLKSHHGAPAPLREHAPGVGGIERQVGKQRRGALEQSDIAPDEQVVLSV